MNDVYEYENAHTCSHMNTICMILTSNTFEIV